MPVTDLHRLPTVSTSKLATSASNRHAQERQSTEVEFSNRRNFIQVEANLLRFPFFALQTKGLSDRKGIEVTGVKNGETFRLRVTRNADTGFPGPLSRKVHFALLSLLFDRHHADTPIENPVRFTWRELAKRADLVWSGARTIDRLKNAIDATHGVVIRTSQALVCRTDSKKKPLPVSKGGYHLYEKYIFTNEMLSDGTLADTNHLWLADWYLANLNSLYSGPLNYDLWRDLNERPIASRIYEYLLFKFTADIPKLIINYDTLAPFLPVRVEPRLSWAKKQLGPAFAHLEKRGVVTRVDWTESRDGKIQLHFHPGPALRRGSRALPPKLHSQDEPELENVTVHELPYSESPSERLVRSFHRHWSDNSNHRPLKGELQFADEMIGEYGFDELDAVMKLVAYRMKAEFPAAKTFVAARQYLPTVISERRSGDTRRKRERRELEAQMQEEAELNAKRQQKAQRRESLMAQWNTLDAGQQEEIRREAVAAIPHEVLRSIVAGKTDLSDPPNEVLEHFASLHNQLLIAA